MNREERLTLENKDHWISSVMVSYDNLNREGFRTLLSDRLAQLPFDTLKASAEEGWRPIESAPKDGAQRIIIAQFRDNGELVDMDFDAVFEEEYESWEIPKPYWIWKSAYGRIEEPTHWMPLPSPPITQSKGGG
jgi:hypothetical protein